MGLRFQRRIRLAKGVHLNLSKSGVGISIGPRGAKFGFGPRGVHYSIGIPGTGISYRKQYSYPIGSAGRRRGPSGSPGPLTGGVEDVAIRLVLDEDGWLRLELPDGTPLPPRLARQVKQDHDAELRRFLAEQCEKVNAGIDEILETHMATPSPREHVEYRPRPFTTPRPPRPPLKQLGPLDRLLPGRRARIEEENRAAEDAWRAELAAWERAKEEHEAREAARRRELEDGLHTDVSVMERVFEERLADLDWPRETELSYGLARGGRSIALDIDLPEVEDMPTMRAEASASRYKLNVKKRSSTQVRKEYMRFVHAIVFRAVGEAFHALPAAEEVIASGYTQRPDPATGQVRDDYLLSVRVDRPGWQAIDFSNLDDVDPIAALERFELVRDMTKTGVFRPITPLALRS